jgi:NAD(P)-dependent dehydrogenase (short-subunit alcohol dehydrogenase family)
MSFDKSLKELVSLKGKTALVTGSASGIGEAIACRFAEAGAFLELIDIDEEKLEKMCAVKGLKETARLHKVDLSSKRDIDALWSKLEGHEPDILVNNAGIYPMRGFLDVDEGFLNKVMEVNLKSVVWMCQHMIRARAKKGGVIVNIGSIEAIMPFKEEMAHYDVSKAGVIALTRALAKEYGRKGFRVNALLPGGILTPGVKNVAKEIAKLKLGIIKDGIEFRGRLPLGRFGKPDEVALMALVLASDASSYVHGTLIPVDGGFLSA